MFPKKNNKIENTKDLMKFTKGTRYSAIYWARFGKITKIAILRRHFPKIYVFMNDGSMFFLLLLRRYISCIECRYPTHIRIQMLSQVTWCTYFSSEKYFCTKMRIPNIKSSHLICNSRSFLFIKFIFSDLFIKQFWIVNHFFWSQSCPVYLCRRSMVNFLNWLE